MFIIGERYLVIVPITKNEPGTFCGTCISIVPIPKYKSFIQLKFANVMDKLGKPLNDILMTLDANQVLHNWKITKVMNFELTQEIQTHYKIPSLVNLCRKHISSTTRIEYQGTFIGDIM